jgi:hypothetical protein
MCTTCPAIPASAQKLLHCMHPVAAARARSVQGCRSRGSTPLWCPPGDIAPGDRQVDGHRLAAPGAPRADVRAQQRLPRVRAAPRPVERREAAEFRVGRLHRVREGLRAGEPNQAPPAATEVSLMTCPVCPGFPRTHQKAPRVAHDRSCSILLHARSAPEDGIARSAQGDERNWALLAMPSSGAAHG